MFLTKNELKIKILEFANSNHDFWKMVNFIQWKELTQNGRVDYHVYMPEAKKRYQKYLNILIRKEKLRKINSKKYIDNKEIASLQLETDYRLLLGYLDDYFIEYFQKNKIGIGDDGYWDLRSTIIGYGKDFLIKCINDESITADMAKNHTYYENFGYIFSK